MSIRKELFREFIYSVVFCSFSLEKKQKITFQFCVNMVNVCCEESKGKPTAYYPVAFLVKERLNLAPNQVNLALV